MSDAAESTPILVHGLLVCRRADLAPEGRLDLAEVLEIVALDELPGDAGPLTFVAFVRGLPTGPTRCAFVIHPAGRPEHVTARLPVEGQVDPAFANRQVALQVRLPSIPVERGGWFDLVFEVDGKPLAMVQSLGAASFSVSSYLRR